MGDYFETRNDIKSSFEVFFILVYYFSSTMYIEIQKSMLYKLTFLNKSQFLKFHGMLAQTCDNKGKTLQC